MTKVKNRETWVITVLDNETTRNWCYSGAPAVLWAAKRSPISSPYMGNKRKPMSWFSHGYQAIGVARGRVRTTTTTTESRNMAAILKITGWQRHVTLVYCELLWHWTSMLWSNDTCQNKLSADQYHVTISRAQVNSSSRSSVFGKLTADQVLGFRLDLGLMTG